MSWQDRLRLLGDRLTAGEITTAQYRVESEEILAEADREAADTMTVPAVPTSTDEAERQKVRIPVSAAWEAPSGEMTQIVGTRDETTLVNRPTVTPIADQLGDETG